MTARERIAQLLAQRERQFQNARDRYGDGKPPQDRQPRQDWDWKVRPKGNLRRGLTGFEVKVEKRF